MCVCCACSLIQGLVHVCVVLESDTGPGTCVCCACSLIQGLVHVCVVLAV